MTRDPWPIKLKRGTTHADPTAIPSWEVLRTLLPVGSCHDAIVIRPLQNGMLARIDHSESSIPCFIGNEEIDSANVTIEVGSSIRVRVVGQQEETRQFEFKLIHPI